MTHRLADTIIKTYFGGSFTYLYVNSYIDAKNQIEFSHNKVIKDMKIYDDDFDAARSGVAKNFVLNCLMSVAWPIFIPATIIPYIATKTK